MKKIVVLIIIFAMSLSLCSCTTTLSGTYSGNSAYGIPVYMTFKGNEVETNIAGIVMNGTYELSENQVTVFLEVYG